MIRALIYLGVRGATASIGLHGILRYLVEPKNADTFQKIAFWSQDEMKFIVTDIELKQKPGEGYWSKQIFVPSNILDNTLCKT